MREILGTPRADQAGLPIKALHRFHDLAAGTSRSGPGLVVSELKPYEVRAAVVF